MPAICAVKFTSPRDAAVFDMETRQMTHTFSVIRGSDDHDAPTLNEALKPSVTEVSNFEEFVLAITDCPSLYERVILEKISAPRSPDVHPWN